MVEVNCRDGGRPTHTRSTPEQTGARARSHVVSKQVLIVLATNLLNGTCQDASRIHSGEGGTVLGTGLGLGWRRGVSAQL